jgi:hypothetical protein
MCRVRDLNEELHEFDPLWMRAKPKWTWQELVKILRESITLHKTSRYINILKRSQQTFLPVEQAVQKTSLSLVGRTLNQLSRRPWGSSVCRRDFSAAGAFLLYISILEKEKRRVSKPLCQQGGQCNFSCEHTLSAWGVWYTLVNTCWQIYK